MDDGVGGGQVQANATGLEADQEQRHFAALELLHRQAAVAGLAGQHDIGNAGGVERLGDQVQHRGELGEKQHLAAFGQQRGQHRHQHVELGRLRGFGAGKLHQTRVAAGLTQLQQRVQHDDVTARQALSGNGFPDLLLHRGAHGFVEVALRRFQFDRGHDLGLGRQLGRHLVLFTAQHERPQAPRQQFTARFVAGFLDRIAPALVEVLLAAKESRQQEIELRPQFAQVVFQRRAGQA